jgi:hypothetical protein
VRDCLQRGQAWVHAANGSSVAAHAVLRSQAKSTDRDVSHSGVTRMTDALPAVEPETGDGRTPTRRRRSLVITSIVVVPIAIGVLVSTVLYSTRVTPSLPVFAPLPSPSAMDAFITDGQVLIVEPATSAPVSVRAGQKIEIVLNTGIGQTVSTLDPSVLEAVANPLCHFTPVCGVTGAGSWTFLARHLGTADLHIIFGTGACPQRSSCPRLLQLLIPITVMRAT